jgi:hypothetical protein
VVYLIDLDTTQSQHAWIETSRELSCALRLLMLAGLLSILGCQSHALPDGNANRADTDAGQLSVSDVRSDYYVEPPSRKIPQVRGILRNLSNQNLLVVEFTLRFKNKLAETIYEEKVYPLYVSPLSGSNEKPLGPDQYLRFAFKSPGCPKSWEPGLVEIIVSKVVHQR